jgi:hypothetical protein
MSKLECGCVELPAAKPRLRLVRKVDPLDPRFVWIECRRQARKKVTEQLRREGVRAAVGFDPVSFSGERRST